MSWGCKQKPNGCGWATRLTYATGEQEWWCDTCERGGFVMAAVTGGSTPKPDSASTPSAPSRGGLAR